MSDYQNMSIAELKAFLKNNQDNTEAFHALMDKLDANPNPQIYGADEIDKFREFMSISAAKIPVLELVPILTAISARDWKGFESAEKQFVEKYGVEAWEEFFAERLKPALDKDSDKWLLAQWLSAVSGDYEKACEAARVLAKHKYKSVTFWIVEKSVTTRSAFGEIDDYWRKTSNNRTGENEHIKIVSGKVGQYHYDVEDAVLIARALESQ